MPAGTHDFEIEQGASFRLQFAWKDSAGTAVNLTGYTARMQVRASTSAPDVLLELTTVNGYITLGGIAGTVTLTLPATVTAGLDWRRGKYDLELVATDALVTRFMQGQVSVSREVTR